MTHRKYTYWCTPGVPCAGKELLRDGFRVYIPRNANIATTRKNLVNVCKTAAYPRCVFAQTHLQTMYVCVNVGRLFTYNMYYE